MSGALLTVAATARMLGRSEWWVRDRIARGVIPSVFDGRTHQVPLARLEAWLAGEDQATPAQVHRVHALRPKGARRVA